MYRGTEEHKDWLFDLHQIYLTLPEPIIRGFLKLYALPDIGVVKGS